MQQRNFYMLVTITALVLAVGGWVELRGQQAAAGAPTRVAVLDLSEVLNGCKEAAAMMAETQGRIDDTQREMSERQTELQDMQTAVGMLGDDTPTRRQTMEQLQLKAIEYKVWVEVQGNRMEMEQTLQTELLYRRALEAIERVAREDGYDLVLYAAPDSSVRGKNRQQLAAAMQLRKVVYAAEGLDITKRVILVMDNEYNNRAGDAE